MTLLRACSTITVISRDLITTPQTIIFTYNVATPQTICFDKICGVTMQYGTYRKLFENKVNFATGPKGVGQGWAAFWGAPIYAK